MKHALNRWVAVGLPTMTVAVALMAGCGSSEQAATGAEDRAAPVESGSRPPVVAVAIPPQRQFVRAIAGDRVEVVVLVPPGADPHTWEPKPRQLEALTRAEVYLGLGTPFEAAWLGRIGSVNPSMTMVDTAAAVERLPVLGGIGPHGPAGHDGHDDHGAMLDPHVWVSPRRVAVQARAIRDALAEVDPDGAAAYDAGLGRFLGRIDRLDAELRERLAGRPGTSFVVFHPSWGYFAADYGLEMIAIEIGGVEPGPADLARLVDIARAKRVRAVFVQPETDRRTAEVIAREIGVPVTEISPLAEDWEENLREAAEAFAEGSAR